ncbi:MAG: carbohydrate ABC transporter permease [Oscillospiraceae bacterium]|jgi:multiple sugar transport system permease protein|nr:carbohydrate ABC transporter permease [Oscillospiraceae bacterium]
MSKMRDTYDQPQSSSYRMKIFIKSALVMLVLVLLTLICLMPIYLMCINATRSNQDIINSALSFLPGMDFVDNFDIAKKRLLFDAFRGFRNSFVIAGASTVLTIFFSCLTAYGLCVYDFKIKDSAFTFIVAVMMVPTQVMGVGFIRFMMNFFGMKLTGTYWPLIIPAIAAPAVVFFMCQNMKATFPFDIIEAARIDGCSEFRTFLTIGMPMLKPAIAVQTIFAFVTNWNNYYTPNMILSSSTTSSKFWGDKSTMPMMITKVISNDNVQERGAQAAVIAISILPLIIAYVILSRFIIEGVALGGVKE